MTQPQKSHLSSNFTTDNIILLIHEIMAVGFKNFMIDDKIFVYSSLRPLLMNNNDH